MKVFGFLGSEIRSMLRNKSVLIPVLGVLVIPLLYSGIYLIANWDPYGNVKNMPVAVVNQDKPVMYEGQEIAVGRELVKKLHENPSVDFHFVTKEEAQKGLDNHDFYLMIEIPEQMSKSATTILDPVPQTMKLIYKENSSYNFLSGQISDKIVEKLKNDVSKTMTETYVEQMFGAINTVSDGLSTASKGAGQIEDGLAQLGDGITDFKHQVNSLIDGKLASADGLMDEYIQKYGQDLQTKLHDQIDQEITKNEGPINDKIHQEIDKTVNLKNDALKEKLHEQIDQYADQYSSVINEKLHDEIDRTMTQYNDAVRQTMHQQIDATMAQYNDAIKQMMHSKLNAELGKYSEPIRQMLHAQVESEVSQHSQEIKAYVIAAIDQELNTQFQKFVADGKKQVGQLDEVVQQFLKDVQPIIDKLPPDQQAKLQEQLKKLEETKNSLGKWMEEQIPALQQKIQSQVNALVSQKLDEMQPQLVAKLHSLVDQKFKELEPAVNSMLNSMLDSKYEELKPELMAKIHAAADSKYDAMQPEVNEKLHEAADMKFNQMKPELVGDIHSAAEDKYNELEPEFLKKFHSAVDEKYFTVLPKLAEQLHDMADEKYKAGKEKVDQIAHEKLTDVKGKVDDAKHTVNGAFDQLLEGQQQLIAGEKELKDKLREGAEKATQDPTASTFEHFANPVASDKESNHDVSSYGLGMAPYFLALGLFVGALMFSIIFPLSETSSRPPSALAWLVSKFGIMTLEGFIQMLIVGLFALYGLDIEVTNTWLFFTVCMVTSLTFFALVQFFTTSFGNVGRFIVIILLVFQLSASAGTFPIELTPDFFQMIHPYLPMTYAIRAFRGVVSSGDFADVWMNLGMMGIFLGSCLVGSYLYFRYRYYKLQKSEGQDQSVSV
ncbi:YhgE/Pip domain-containing protein [Paenibacillus terrigena]|uniref:YhgE/Pip domain-containing protein n=1 Tax=Paenibacillus terrigena TaxID=369333 RepID=UPI0028D07307|nr:YhgE/Pip domain-containing protein [Paenibacillus terrigena]